MGYSYVYIIAGIAVIASLSTYFYFQSHQVTGAAPKNLDSLLEVACNNGDAPVMAAFFLNDPQNIGLEKTWYWDDGKAENNSVNVNNHRYTLEGTNKTSKTFQGSVVEWSSFKPLTAYGYANFSVTVTRSQETTVLDKLDQWESVIIQGDSVGFSTSTKSNFPDPIFTWRWNDTSIDPVLSGLYPNPSHKYADPAIYNGSMLEQGPGASDTKKFCVLVLPSAAPTTVKMNVSFYGDTGQTQFYPGHALRFDTISYTGTGARPSDTANAYNATSEWNFGDGGRELQWCNDRQHTIDNCYTYSKAGNYTVRYNGTDQLGFPVNLTKTIMVFPLPSISILQLHNANGKQVFHVKGQNFSPEAKDILFVLCFDGSRCMEKYQIGDTNQINYGEFDSDVTVPTHVSGPQGFIARSTLCNDPDCVDNATAIINFTK